MPIHSGGSNLRRPARGTAEGVDVIANSPDSLQTDLDRAVAQIRSAAAEAGRGIRVTRRSASLFTVEAAADVPCGITVENDSWQRPTSTRAQATLDKAAL
jgi:hypothetical protein